MLAADSGLEGLENIAEPVAGLDHVAELEGDDENEGDAAAAGVGQLLLLEA